MKQLLSTIFLALMAVMANAQEPFDPNPPVEPNAQYKIRVSVSPAEAGTASGAGSYATGRNVSISTSAKADYTFSHWEVDGTTYGTKASFTYTVEEANKHFVAVYEYTPRTMSVVNLQAEPADACSFNRSSGVSYEKGAQIYINAYANQGFAFKGWYSGETLVSETLSFNHTVGGDDVTLVARFEYDPTLPSDPTGGAQEDVDNSDVQTNSYFYVNDLRVKTGTSVQIPVCMASEEENIVGFQCEIALPEGMEFAKNAQGQCILTWNKDRADDHTFSTKMLGNGVVRIVAKSNNLYEFYDTDGELFYINATVSDGMADGEYAMTLSDVRLSTNDLVEIKCPEVKATVSVYSYTYGDLNDDGEWSIIDVTMELRNMLENIYMPAGDMNDDGQITIIDLTRVIQCVLDKDLPTATYAPRQQAAAVGSGQERVVVGNIVARPNDECELVIATEGLGSGYRGCQMDIALPEGFEFCKNNRGRYVVALDNGRCETHAASTKLQDDGKLRVALSSDYNDVIGNADGMLLTVKIRAKGDAAAGNYECEVSNIRFADTEVESVLDNSTGTLRTLGMETIALIIPEGGYATLCLPFAAELRDGLKAYKAVGMEDDVVVMEEQSSIEACTPLIVCGEQGEYSFTGDNSNAAAQLYKADALTGVIVPTEFADGYTLQQVDGVPGFYKMGNATTIPAYSCVLDIAATPAHFAIQFKDTATGIGGVAGVMPKGRIYTTDGREAKTMERGRVYIINGTKMLIK